MDYFRTEANTNGTVLNDGPNGYDNDGDSWFTGNDNIDNDGDSDDFSDWGIDGIGPYLTDEYGGLVIDSCSSCEAIVNSQADNASYDSKYDLWFIDEDNDGQWTTNNEYYPFLPNPNYSGPDQGEGNGIPDPGEPGVNYAGLVVVDSIDIDCDGCDYDNDGYPSWDIGYEDQEGSEYDLAHWGDQGAYIYTGDSYQSDDYILTSPITIPEDAQNTSFSFWANSHNS